MAVGRGQLHPKVRDDPRVTVRERTDIRAVALDDLGGPVDLVVGKVFVLLWPADRFRWNTRPATFEDVPDPSS